MDESKLGAYLPSHVASAVIDEYPSKVNLMISNLGSNFAPTPHIADSDRSLKMPPLKISTEGILKKLSIPSLKIPSKVD